MRYFEERGGSGIMYSCIKLFDVTNLLPVNKKQESLVFLT